MTILIIGLICVAVAMFAALCGVTIGVLHKKSHPTDIAGAVSRGLLIAGAAFAGTFVVIGVIVVLATQFKSQPTTSPPTTHTTTAAPTSPVGAPVEAR
ncbi:hypothetical protein ACIBEH_13590 [Nocardia salmonicida]|uniref:hypothetical protein n=1 Tax=Nocardia salmonicida TaxID=53431 RepID=UPI00379BD76E